VLIALAVLATGCGKSEDEIALDKINAERGELFVEMGRELDQLQQDAARAAEQNQNIRSRIQTINDNLLDANREMESISSRAVDMQKKIVASDAAEKAINQKMASAGGGFFTLILIIIIVILIIYAIFRFLRSRSEFEDEDEDFADFEDDEDLGFDEGNDLEDDLSDDRKKKKNDTTNPPGDNI